MFCWHTYKVTAVGEKIVYPETYCTHEEHYTRVIETCAKCQKIRTRSLLGSWENKHFGLDEKWVG